MLQQLIHHVPVVRFTKELDHRLRDDVADAIDGIEFVPCIALHAPRRHHLLAEVIGRAIGARQRTRRGLADVADAEREDEPVEPDGAARIDGIEQLPDARLAPALAVLQALEVLLVAFPQREHVMRPGDEAIGVEFLDDLVAQPLDVEGIARGEMLQPFDALCGTDEAAGAAAHRIDLAGHPLLAHRMGAADRAFLREVIGPGMGRTLLRHETEDLRNDVACALHDHRVALADVLAGDLVLVVQRGVGDDNTTHGHGLKPRDGGESTRAAHLDIDLLQHRRRLLGGELVGEAPAWAARHEAEALLPVEAVHLVDDAVDVIAEIRALALDQAILRKELLDGMTDLGQGIGWQAPAFEGLDDAHLGLGRKLRRLAPGIGKEPQRARCGDGGIKLAERTRSGVARVGKDLLARLNLFLIECREVLVGHVYFTTHLDQVRGPDLEPLRHVMDGHDIGGDVLALIAVAASRRLHKLAVLVAQRDGEAVDLRFGGDIHRLIFMQIEEAADAAHEVARILLRETVGERQHGYRVAQLAEFLGRTGADAARWRVFSDQIGKARLDRLVALTQGIILGIRDQRRILLVIGSVVLRDLGGKCGQFGGGLEERQVLDRRLCLLRHGLSLGPQEFVSLGSRRFGDLGTRQHARHFLAAALVGERLNARDHALRGHLLHLGNQHVLRGTCRHLRAVGNGKHLEVLGEAREAPTDGIGHGAAHTGVDLVEDQGRRGTLRCKDHFQCQHEACELAAGRYLHQGRERSSGIGGHHELNAVDAGGAGLAGVSFKCGLETRALELQRRQFGHHCLVERFRRLAALVGELLRSGVEGLTRRLEFLLELLQTSATIGECRQLIVEALAHVGQRIDRALELARRSA